MLTVPEVQATQFLPHPSSPIITVATAAAPPTGAKKCDAHTCPWWPYSNSKDFKTNAGLIVLILFFAVIFVLSLNAAARYLLRRRRRSRHNHNTEPMGLEHAQPKPVHCWGPEVEPPTVLFTAGMKLAGAEAECAICLSEFVEGEGIRVLEKCKHGFHVQCVQKWLISRSSCPTCRSICHPPQCSVSGEVAGCISGNGAHGDLESGGRVSEGGPQPPLV